MVNRSAAITAQAPNPKAGLLWLFLPIVAVAMINAQSGLASLADGLGRMLGQGARSGAAAVVAPSAAAVTLAESQLCLAQAVYYEARGESLVGQQAVAQVVLNRVRDGKFRPTVCGVVYQGAERGHGCQFSFACDGSMKRAMDDGAWRRAQAVAAQALGGYVLAAVGSATHYHTRQVSPYWRAKMTRVGVIGDHIFYDHHHRRAAKAQTA